VIKRIRFTSRRPDVAAAAFESAWPAAVGGIVAAPPDVRPARATVCTTLPGLSPDPKHDGIAAEWFTDEGHLARFEAWTHEADGQAWREGLAEVVDPDSSPVLLAEEVVQRGSEWLDARWRDGGVKLKHLALARRSLDLTPEEFSARWRDHGGQVRPQGAPAPVPIAEEARGCAYVQNHPLPHVTGEWAYDALTEIWLDDMESLHTRVQWFRENLPNGVAPDLFRESWLLSAREEVVLADDQPA
jgi:hypothetical protein